MQRTPAASRRARPPSSASRARVRGWMGNTTGARAGELDEPVDDRGQARRVVHVGGPVQRHEHVRALAHAERGSTPRGRARAPSQRRSESIIVLPT